MQQALIATNNIVSKGLIASPADDLSGVLGPGSGRKMKAAFAPLKPWEYNFERLEFRRPPQIMKPFARSLAQGLSAETML
jgi:hypothetical protein